MTPTDPRPDGPDPAAPSDGPPDGPPADVAGHVPDADLRERAERAGIDLDRLRVDDPDAYRMLASAPLALVAPALQEAASAGLARAAPDARPFALPERDGLVPLRVFPPLGRGALERFDAAMGEEVLREPWAGARAYYRVVRDRRGERRELALPLPPAAWDGREGMVGPFEDEAAADAWGRERVAGANAAPDGGGSGPRLVHDAVPYAGAWFCDVFPGDEG